MLQRATNGSNHNQVSREQKSKKNKCNPNLKNKQTIYETNQAGAKG